MVIVNAVAARAKAVPNTITDTGLKNFCFVFILIQGNGYTAKVFEKYMLFIKDRIKGSI